MLDIREIWIHMKAVFHSTRQIVNSELASVNLTGAEGDIIFHLLSKNDGLSQEKLAERLYIDKSAISRTVKSLEKKGYINRVRKANDSRTYCITLTNSVKDVSERIEHAYKIAYEASMRGISESELQCFDKLLEKVHKNLNTRG